jgi:3-oxoacyl-[acyl-carrier protein] reductase
MPEDCAGLVVFLSSDASTGVTGQCIGIGGDRLSLWSHPQEALFELRDGGWSAEEIATAWAQRFASQQQSYGIELAELDLEEA